MNNRREVVQSWLVVLVLIFVASPALSAEQSVFEMQEVSIFDEKEISPALRDLFAYQADALCRTDPDPRVKAYPKFHSTNPLYGAVKFGDAQPLYSFVFDESAGTGTGYDRFYFDAQNDLDLTNDPPLALSQTPSPDLFKQRPPWLSQEDDREIRLLIFDCLKWEVDDGPEYGKRSIHVLPRLYLGSKAYAVFMPVMLRKGTIQLGNRQSTIVFAPRGLKWSYEPFNHLDLVSDDMDTPWQKKSFSESLCKMREVDGKTYYLHEVDERIYRLSATPPGNQIVVQAYYKKFGVFEIGQGERNIETPRFRGTLVSKEASIELGNAKHSAGGPSFPKYRVPEGDYLPSCLYVEFGKLRIFVLEGSLMDNNPHRQQSDRSEPWIKIRQDKPYVLEFSDQPTILMRQPKENEKLTPGQNIMFTALLIDPVKDIRISSIYLNHRRIAPVITILDSTGRQLIHADMRDGCGDDHVFSWQVPKEFSTPGPQTFLVTVTYDTQELYGKVEVSRKLVVEYPVQTIAAVSPWKAAITINSAKYAPVLPLPNESLTVPFTAAGGISTSHKYQGLVQLFVQGTGHSHFQEDNDAFYIINNPTNGTFNPGLSNWGNYYQLAVDTQEIHKPTLSTEAAKEKIFYDIDANHEITTRPYVPQYRTDHAYSMVIDTGKTSSNLYFAVSDGSYWDNGGYYRIEVTQLAPILEQTTVLTCKHPRIASRCARVQTRQSARRWRRRCRIPQVFYLCCGQYAPLVGAISRGE